MGGERSARFAARDRCSTGLAPACPRPHAIPAFPIDGSLSGMTRERRGGADRVEAICRSLRRAIVERALAPGDRLPEDASGERFGVSRTTRARASGNLPARGWWSCAATASPRWQARAGRRRATPSTCASAWSASSCARLAGRLTADQHRRAPERISTQEEAAQPRPRGDLDPSRDGVPSAARRDDREPCARALRQRARLSLRADRCRSTAGLIPRIAP